MRFKKSTQLLIFCCLLSFSASAQRVYYTQGNNIISRNLDGGDQVIHLTNGDTPYRIEVDPSNNYCFFLTNQGQSDAYRVNLSTFGSQNLIYSYPAFTDANNIAGHPGDEILYYTAFVDSDPGHIWYSNYDDSDCCQNPTTANLGTYNDDTFHDIDIDTDNERVYMSNEFNNRIYYIPTFGGATPTTVHFNGAGESFVLDLDNSRLIYEDPANDHIMTSDLAGGSISTLISGGLSDIRAIDLAPDGRIVILDGSTIKLADSDGSNLTTRASGLSATDLSVGSCSTPSTQTSNLVVGVPGSNSVTLGWTNGSGDETIVVAKEGAPVDANALNGFLHNPSSTFGSGEELGNNNFVVYRGTGSGVTVTGLTESTEYYFEIYTLNSFGACYRSVAPLTTMITTDCSDPTISPSGFTPSSIGTSTMDFLWSRGNGNGVIVVMSENSVSTGIVDGVDYTGGVNSDFSLAADIGSGDRVVYSGTGTSVSVTGLTAGTTYEILVFEYNTPGFCYRGIPAQLFETTLTIPNITAVSIPNFPMNIGDVITVVMSVDNDLGIPYSFVSGDIVGLPITGFNKLDDFTYRGFITIPDGGTDFAASDDLAVNNLVFENSEGVDGNTFNGIISQGNDPIDANRPSIDSFNGQIPSPTNATSLVYQVVFNEDVTGVDDTDWTGITTGSVTFSGFSVTPLNATTYNISVNNVAGDGTFQIDASAATITDILGNSYIGADLSTVFTVDNTAPAFNNAFLSNPTFDGFDITFNLNDLGDVDWVASQDGTVPTQAQVSAGLDASGTVAEASGTINVTAAGSDFSTTTTGLLANTTYFVHYLSYDALGNQSLVMTLNITTDDDTPVITLADVTIVANSNCTPFNGSITVNSITPDNVADHTFDLLDDLLAPIITGAGPSFTDLGPGDYNITATSLISGKTSAPLAFTINDITVIPIFDAGSNEEVCGGSGFDLSTSTIPPTASGVTSILWTTSGDGSFDDNTLLTPIYTPGPTDEGNAIFLTMTITAASGCPGGADLISLSVTIPPTVDAGSDEEICGNSFDLSTSATSPSASDVVGLLWTTAGDGIFDDPTSLTPVYTAGPTDLSSTVTLTLEAFGNGSCVSVTDAVNLTFNQLPVANAGSDEETCESVPFDLSTSVTIPSVSNVSAINWTTSGDGSFSDNTILTPVYTPGPSDPGNTITLTLDVTGIGSCPSTVDAMALTVTRVNTVNAGTDEEVCGNSFDLSTSATPPSAANFSSLLWTTIGDGTFDDPTALTPVYTAGPTDLGSSVTLTLEAVGNGSCLPVTDVMVVTFNQLPIVEAGSDENACNAGFDLATSATPPSASNFAAINWTTSGDGIFDDATAIQPVYTPGVGDAGTVVTLTMNITALGSCTNTSDFMSLTVDVPPTANAGSDEETCTGIFDLTGSVTGPTATNFSSLLWTSSGTGSFDDATALNPIYTASAGDIGSVVTLTLEAFGNGICTSVTDDMQLTVSRAPITDAGSDETICANETMDLSTSAVVPAASDFSSLQWTTDGAGSFNDPTSLTPVYSPSDSDAGRVLILTLEAIGNGSCNSVMDQMQLTVNPIPVADGGEDQTACLGDLVQLDASASTGSNLGFSWSPTTGLDDPSSATPMLNTSVLGAGSFTYTLTVSDDAACSDMQDVSITVNPIPTASMVSAGNISVICQNESIDLAFTLTGNGPFDVTYNDGNSDVTLTGISNGHQESVTPSASTTYSLVSVVDNNNCSNTASGNVSVTVNPLPVVNINLDPLDVCVGEILTVTTSGATSYTININGQEFNSSGTLEYTANANDIGTLSITATGTDANGCVSEERSASAEVGELPNTAFALPGSNGELCVNAGTVEFTPEVSGGTFVIDGNPITGNSFDPADIGVGNHSVTYTVSQSGCSSTSSPTSFDIIDAPDPDFTVSEPVIVQTPADFSATGTGTFEWDFGDGNTGGGQNTSHTYRNGGEKTITLTVTNAGCSSQVQKTIFVEAFPVSIMNTITPNGDNQNDFLYIKDIEDFPNQVIVINRWGAEIFKTDNYNNNSNFWNGDAPSGNYICVVKINDIEVRQMISVMR